MTDNEPTVRYWRHTYGRVDRHRTSPPLNPNDWTEVVVLTPAELAAIKADAWDEGARSITGGHVWTHNPYRSTEER